MALTVEQLNNFQTQAEKIIKFSKRKEALELARQLEAQIAGSEVGGAELFQSAEKLIVQLKWMACPLIRNDREFFELIKNKFLEGLELDAEMGLDFEMINVSDLTTERLASQFGVGLEETVLGILETLRKNNQIIGSQPITIKGAAQATRPTIQNWLLDFLKNTPAEDPTAMEETDYLFNNQNTQTLSEEEKKLLGKVLAFYDTFRLILKELTNLKTQERIEMESYLPQTETETETKPFSPRPISAPAAAPISAARKTLREAVQENKEIFNQLLTINPIKISGAEELVSPTLRNWLADYVKDKGARLHQTSERNDYLTQNPNAQKLPAEERAVLAEILKAYDEPKTFLPFSNQTRQISVNELRGRPNPPKQTTPPSKNPPAFSTPSSSSDRYREPVPPHPIPRISGNVIDLKEFKE